MELEDLYPLQGFELTSIVKAGTDVVLLNAISTSRLAKCPYCGTRSNKRHSYYSRKPQALPCSETRVQIVLNVQRYFCENSSCLHKTFAERIPRTAQFYAHRTSNLDTLLKHISFEMSAEATARVCERLKIRMSPDTILRLIRNTKVDNDDPVRILGVDDWAKKKGQNYGTILVDLEKHKAIDLLPDRTQETLGQWLQNHPEIEVISRDRSFEYRAGIETGAPQAVQVVDRWHLLHNMREKLQETMPDLLKKKDSEPEKAETPSYQKRKKYFELVNYLYAKGYSQRLIARVLEISRGTVIRYINEMGVPDYRPKTITPSQLDIYEGFIRKRWKDGLRDATILWKELKEKGYTGQRKSVLRYLESFQERNQKYSTAQLAWLFMKDENELKDEEKAYLYPLFVGNQKLKEIYQLVQEFQKMLSQKQPEILDDWLEKTEKCGVKKLQNFAFGLRQDYAAVRAALIYDWSNGQVEGQVNRLKTIKRQMYGRANFDLLRQRVLGPP